MTQRTTRRRRATSPTSPSRSTRPQSKANPDTIWVRLYPYDPEAGHKAKVRLISPLNLRFEAGVFQEVPIKVWQQYLQHEVDEYPPFRPLYQGMDFDSMRRTVQLERKAALRAREELDLGGGRGMVRRRSMSAGSRRTSTPASSASRQQRFIKQERDHRQESLEYLRGLDMENASPDQIDQWLEDTGAYEDPALLDMIGEEFDLHFDDGDDFGDDDNWSQLTEELNEFRGSDGTDPSEEAALDKRLGVKPKKAKQPEMIDPNPPGPTHEEEPPEEVETDPVESEEEPPPAAPPRRRRRTISRSSEG